MENYEKTIGLKTIWQTIIRRWKIILIIFIPVALGTVVVTQFVMKKNFQSSMSYLNNTNMNATQHSAAVVQIKKAETLDQTVANLAALEKPITITSDAILAGLSVAAFNSSNPGVVSMTWTSTNQSIVQPVLDELSKVALQEIKANASLPNMTISSAASAAKNVSKSKTYLLIGLAGGFVLGCVFAFIDEIVSDEVYDKDDIQNWGAPAFEITVSK